MKKNTFKIKAVAASLLAVCLVLSLVLAMFIDGFTQLKGWRRSNNYLRVITGLGFGYAIVSFIFHIVKMIILLCS